MIDCHHIVSAQLHDFALTHVRQIHCIAVVVPLHPVELSIRLSCEESSSIRAADDMSSVVVAPGGAVLSIPEMRRIETSRRVDTGTLDVRPKGARKLTSNRQISGRCR